MSNESILVEAFSNSLGIDKNLVKDELKYNSIPEWDSIAHMTLVAEIEGAFDIMLDTDDIIDMNTVEKSKEILKKYGVDI
ncbi:acyl carrier protein [Vibrio toranzoniae]|uniref:acyl carrier protein n=1 Tax=Vibrio toranzoniae TaxID=1194427 RepID=UPI00137674B0|nr:acyl carrier protein [Vibrio toranzoniae]NAZ91675.1 acyl carrier protein [Vibrio toranzoniae]